MGKMAGIDFYILDELMNILKVVVFLHMLQHCFSSVCCTESHTQAYIQTDDHLAYIDGSLMGIPININARNLDFQEKHKEESNLLNVIQLAPSMLDFQEQPIGMPRLERVMVQNTGTQDSIRLVSISGSSVQFHCSFFQDKTVPPEGNTTFDVIFLARQEGAVKNTLYIHTSVGSFHYQVIGAGIPNPFRLKPYIGARVPVNSTFSPVIQIHNPFSSKLRVVEMFSSAGDLHLELPSRLKQTNRELWEIEPFETKRVMQATFVGRVANNHTAFICIRTDQENRQQLLILPVEVEFCAGPGLFSPVQLLDFGTLRPMDGRWSLNLRLINTGSKAVLITSVTASPANDAVTVDFQPLMLEANGSKPCIVAHVTYDASVALRRDQWRGEIVVTTSNGHRVSVPFEASVLFGFLHYRTNDTSFYSAPVSRNFTRPLVLTSTFNFSTVIFNATLPPEAVPFFSVLNFTRPRLLRPHQMVTVLTLLFHSFFPNMHLCTFISIHTNASIFNIPIVVYNGFVKVTHHRPELDNGRLDFGAMVTGERRATRLTIHNDNPVDLVMRNFECNETWVNISLIGLEISNRTGSTHFTNTSDGDADQIILKPYYFAVFNVSIQAPKEEGVYLAEAWMLNQFQDLFLHISLTTAKGRLLANPEKIAFEDVYPVTRISFQPDNTGFYFEAYKGGLIMHSQTSTTVGKVYFDHRRECLYDCYLGLSTISPAGHQWLLGLSLHSSVVDTDQYLYTRCLQKWKLLERSGRNVVNATLEMATDHAHSVQRTVRATMKWPSLVRESTKLLPLTLIGNTTVAELLLENSADVHVLVQVVPLYRYPSPDVILDIARDRSLLGRTEFVNSSDVDTFQLLDTNHTQGLNMSSFGHHADASEGALRVTAHKNTVAAVLSPGQNFTIRIAFQPKDSIITSTIFLIRNNLTILDMAIVSGQGCYGELMLANRLAGSDTPLSFDLTEARLRDCDATLRRNPNSPRSSSNFTIKRSFTLQNTGPLAFWVRGLSINNSPCVGDGFLVVNCGGFEMAPNSVRKIIIAFTPDFSVSRVRRMLIVHTSLGPSFNFTLQATVPLQMLHTCATAVPRHYREFIFYCYILVTMVLTLLSVLLFAYFDADRICSTGRLTDNTRTVASGVCDGGGVFDLSRVAGLPGSRMVETHVGGDGDGVAFPPSIVKRQAAGAHTLTSTTKRGHWTPGPEYCHHISSNPVLRLIRCAVPSGSFFLRQVRSIFHSPEWSHQHPRLVATPVGSLSGEFVSHGGVTGTDNLADSDNCPADDTDVEPKPTALVRQHMMKPSKRTKIGRRLSAGLPLGQLDRALPGHSFDLNRVAPPFHSTPQVDPCHLNKADLLTTGVCAAKAVAKLEASGGMSGKPQGKKSRKQFRLVPNAVKEGHRRHNVSDDRDESASTTTESSSAGGGEQEDKNINIWTSACQTSELKSNYVLQAQLVNEIKHDDENEEDDNSFELTSKCKAHRKLRVNQKIYGGDIRHPRLDRTLELDYTLPKEKKRLAESSAWLGNPPKDVHFRPESVLVSHSPSVEDDSDQELSAPVLDAIRCSGGGGDGMLDLTHQTQSFVRHIAPSESITTTLSSSIGHMRHGRALSARVTSPSSSTYSSVVGGACGLSSPSAFCPTSTSSLGREIPLAFADGTHDSVSRCCGGQADHCTKGNAVRRRHSRHLQGNTGKEAAGDPFGIGLGFNMTSFTSSSANSHCHTSWKSRFPSRPSQETGPLLPSDDASTSSTGIGQGGSSDTNLSMMQQLQAEHRWRFTQFMEEKHDEWPRLDFSPLITIDDKGSSWDADRNTLDDKFHSADLSEAWNFRGAPATATSEKSLPSLLENGWNNLQGVSPVWNTHSSLLLPPGLQQSSVPSAAGSSVSSLSGNSHHLWIDDISAAAPPSAARPAAVSSTAATGTAQINMDCLQFSPFSTTMADIWKPVSMDNLASGTWGPFQPPPQNDE